MKTIKELKANFYNKIPSNEIDLIIAFVIKKDRVFVLTYPDYKLSTNQETLFSNLIKQRHKQYPMAYILGHKDFFNSKFIVNEDVLIPRPETELMVEEAIKISKKDTESKTIIDVGTGSGCIIISLAKELGDKHNYTGIDVSGNALFIAKRNARLNFVAKNIRFIKSNLLSEIKNLLLQKQNNQIIITANLPYLTPKQISASPSIKKEPRLALVAGADGLKYYDNLFRQISKLKSINKNLKFTILCEIDPTQKDSIKKSVSKLFQNNFSLEIKKDYKNHSRLVIIKEKKPSVN